MKLTIGIPVFNGAAYVNTLLQSIQQAIGTVTYPLEIVIVDDGSTDNIGEVCNSFPNLPINLIAFQENRGATAANNKILEIAKGEYILRLDADTVVNAKALIGLIDYMDKNSSVGAVVPKLVGIHGDNQSTIAISFKEPYEWIGDYALWIMKLFKKQFSFFDRIHQPIQIAYAGTGAIMMRKIVVDQVGYFDEQIRFFMEDADYVWRITCQAWKVMYHPDFEVVHIGGQSGKLYIHMRQLSLTNLHRFYAKHRPGTVTQLVLDISIVAGTSISIILLLLALPLYIFPEFRTIITRAAVSYWSVVLWYSNTLRGRRV